MRPGVIIWLILGLIMLWMGSAVLTFGKRALQAGAYRHRKAVDSRATLVAMRRLCQQQCPVSDPALDEQLLSFLPAHALRHIAEDSTHWSDSGVPSNSVSAQPRSAANLAGTGEPAVMTGFRAHPAAQEYNASIQVTDSRNCYHFALDLAGSVLCAGRVVQGTAIGFNRRQKRQRSSDPLCCTVVRKGRVLDIWQRPTDRLLRSRIKLLRNSSEAIETPAQHEGLAGLIRLSALPADQDLGHIAVRDNGAGMAPGDARQTVALRLFDQTTHHWLQVTFGGGVCSASRWSGATAKRRTPDPAASIAPTGGQTTGLMCIIQEFGAVISEAYLKFPRHARITRQPTRLIPRSMEAPGLTRRALPSARTRYDAAARAVATGGGITVLHANRHATLEKNAAAYTPGESTSQQGGGAVGACLAQGLALAQRRAATQIMCNAGFTDSAWRGDRGRCPIDRSRS